MFTIEVDNQKKQYKYDDYIHVKFMLMCESKTFTITHPNGYISTHKPPIE